MTARDILKQHFQKVLNDNYIKDAVYPETWVEVAMIEYAEYYAKRCLKIAAENAVALERDYNDDWYVDTNSILNIELPSHD